MFFLPTGSTRRLPSPWVLIAIGMMMGSIGAALTHCGGRWAWSVRRTATDYLTISGTGPQLGMRSDPGEIVIVRFGHKSAQRLGTKPVVETDKLAYENLLAAGAKAVADPRVIAALLPEDFDAAGKPVLE